jgi:predicted metalloprotease with PDZ domain
MDPCSRRALLAVAVAALLAPGASAQPPKARPITVAVDLTESPRKLLKARLVIPAQPGPLRLCYPKWIPGEHGPTGPITDLAGLKITAQGSNLPWRRDDVDLYAFSVTVPEGADAVEVTLNFLTPATTSGFSAGACCTSRLAVLNWNQVVLYPSGQPAREILCRPSVRLPDGWKLGTALKGANREGQFTHFDTVSLEQLIDSPVLAGAHLRDLAIGPLGTPGAPSHSIALAGDSASAVEVTPAVKENLDRLVEEAHRLFGARHYRAYKFLLTLSDQVAHFGLEHHESSDNRVAERMLANGKLKKSVWATLLPHEYVHSWNGKYRRPKEMITDDFQKPQRTSLLWVYEGLTQYLGVVLTARSGLWTDAQFRENLALVADWAKNQRGRTWRPLEDTAVAAQLLYGSRADWASWRRSVDFYDEGILIWLEVDTLLRQKSGGKRSLDDFCRRFHGGKGGAPQVKPFTLEELAADLHAVVPHDWKRLLTERVTSTSAAPPLDGLKRGGWRLGYADKPPGLQGWAGDDKVLDLTASVGMLLKEDGSVTDVVPGKAAHKAGVGPGMKVIAVNSRRFSAAGLRAALRETKTGGKLELLLENGEFFRTFALAYRDGERYPRLEREAGTPDLLADIVRPLAAPAKAGAAAGK